MGSCDDCPVEERENKLMKISKLSLFLLDLKFKVHLTPKLFFRLNKFCYHLEHFFAKIV